MKNHPSPLALNLFTLLLFMFVASPINGIAQKVTDDKPFEITFYDKDWKRVTDRKKAQYYRHVFKTTDPEKVLVKDFYMSGQLQYECFATDYDSRDANEIAHDGICKWYEPDGRLSREAEYRLGKQEGLSKTWDSDGELTVEYYVNDVQEGQSNIFDKDGVLIGRITYSRGVPDKLNVICPPAGCIQAYLEEFFDNYVANSRDWIFDDSTFFLDPEGLSIRLSSGSEIIQINKLGLENDGRWDISMDFQFSKPKGRVDHGLVFGASNRGNFVAFTISSDGTYSISERRNNVEKIVIDRKKSSAIAKIGKVNRLRVTRADDGFQYWINNEIVYKQESVRWHGGDVGMVSRGNEGQIGVWQFFYATPVEKPTDTELKPPAWWNGSGSGFILSTEGFVVTNHHVIEDAKRIEIDIRNGEDWATVVAEVVAFDAASDLAILKFDPSALKHIDAIPFSIKTEVADLGTKVFTMGFPQTNYLGSDLKFSEGSVSSRSGYKGDVTAYQVSVPIHGGNSGGPLFDSDGSLIGIIKSSVPGLQNVSYGIKASYLADMIKSMDNGPKIPSENKLGGMSETERIKALSELVVFIKVRD
jgi:S1-C subfamily serine protease